MFIRDILSIKGNGILSVTPEVKVADAVSQMAKHDVGSQVVMQGGHMIGLVTFREVLLALHASGGSLGDLRVAEIMLKEPICGTPDDTIEHLREVMTRHHVRYLPVMENDKLLGVISFHDVTKAVISETSFENRLLKRYIKNWPDEDGKH